MTSASNASGNAADANSLPSCPGDGYDAISPDSSYASPPMTDPVHDTWSRRSSQYVNRPARM